MPVAAAATTLNEHFCLCGQCGGDLPLQAQKQRTAVVLVGAEGEGFVVCPFCYNNPSGKNGVEIEDLCLGETLPCFKCRAACTHASGWRVER